jgi:hypothetical protein
MNPSEINVKELAGFGYWALLHKGADKVAKLNSYDDKIRFSVFVVQVISLYPCAACVAHATEYISGNPLAKVIRDPDPYAFVKYFWVFHNFVNDRIGKETVSYQECLDLWGQGNAPCLFGGC